MVRRLKSAYQRILAVAFRRHGLVIGVAFVLFLITLATLPFMGRAFLPEFNEGTLTINAVTLPGTSLEESNRLGQMVESILLSFPEVKSTARRTGRAELDEHAQGVEAAEIDVGLEMQKRSKEEFLQELRRALTAVPGMNITIGQPISHRIDHMLSGTRANIAVKIFGHDLRQLANPRSASPRHHGQGAGRRRSLHRAADGHSHSSRSIRSGAHRPSQGSRWKRLPRPWRQPFSARRFRACSKDREALIWSYAPKMRTGRVSTPSAPRLIDTPLGGKVPLALAGRGKEGLRAKHDQPRRRATKDRRQLKCRGSRFAGSCARHPEQRHEQCSFPRGYYVTYGGQFESAEDASQTIGFLSVLVIAGIVLLLTVALRSLRDALIILVNLPLALIGGIFGIFLSGGVLSVASLIGLITLFGIAAQKRHHDGFAHSSSDGRRRREFSNAPLNAARWNAFRRS